MPTINSKDECNKAIQLGQLGNSLRTWRSKDELFESGYNGLLGIRSLTPGGLFESPKTVQEALASKRSDIYFSEFLDTTLITIQGELMQSPEYLTLRYTTGKEQMRYAFIKESEHYEGLRAKLCLDIFLTPSSREDINELLDIYPDHIIEFTACKTCVGPNPGRNAIIWEVRNY